MDLVSCLSGSSCGSKSWSLTYRIRHCRRRKPITWGRCWRRLKKWAISIRQTSRETRTQSAALSFPWRCSARLSPTHNIVFDGAREKKKKKKKKEGGAGPIKKKHGMERRRF